ncbi:Rad1/Rec1/Rad17 [Coprinopsis sp. MPI-PUGE-AT-0042]|nr:Rad1/Rec1/Rad17 [Coprinopsis sp. MPI-PUGE-AT-0042]
MSQEPQGEEPKPILSTMVNDVRYFAAVLRGVHFSNMATVTITKQGLTITVEEARTLLGTAFIFSEMFDIYEYYTEAEQRRAFEKQERRRFQENSQSQANAPSDDEPDDADDEPQNAAFQVHLNILIECINIFGTAGPMATPFTSNTNTHKKWRRGDEETDHEGVGGGGGRRGGDDLGNRRIEAFLGGGPANRTNLRMIYPGNGYPLSLIVAEETGGPTTTCEITTYDPEPQLDLNFDNSKLVLKIILKSSWLRDALSELDPSCEKLTLMGNPSLDESRDPSSTGRRPQKRAPTTPLFRIQANGTFGSTEMDYPDDKEVLETFECSQRVQFTYRLPHILKTLRALSSSTKTSLRIDEDGLLSLQFLMPSPKPRGEATDAFIEFRCLALDDS